MAAVCKMRVHVKQQHLNRLKARLIFHMIDGDVG